MTQPVLPAMFSDPPQPRKSGHVPATSVQAYRELPNKDDRAAFAVELVTQWPGRTSHELSVNYYGRIDGAKLENVLHIRRGLSDAKEIGLVQHGEARKCRAGGKVCVTWRVTGRR